MSARNAALVRRRGHCKSSSVSRLARASSCAGLSSSARRHSSRARVAVAPLVGDVAELEVDVVAQLGRQLDGALVRPPAPRRSAPRGRARSPRFLESCGSDGLVLRAPRAPAPRRRRRSPLSSSSTARLLCSTAFAGIRGDARVRDLLERASRSPARRRASAAAQNQSAGGGLCRRSSSGPVEPALRRRRDRRASAPRCPSRA